METTEIESIASRVRATMRDVPDFPTPGIQFKDITPVLADRALMSDVIRAMCDAVAHLGITHVVGIESRGFLFGMPIALQLGASFAPARKPGKLPWTTAQERYSLEYGEDALEMHIDAVGAGSRVLIVDDVLATGGTAAAAARLVRRLGGEVCGIAVLSELGFLGGRARLRETTVYSLVRY